MYLIFSVKENDRVNLLVKYRQVWDRVMVISTDHGATISHHHGIGLVRARFFRQALGSQFGVLESIKYTFDPLALMNPGKLDLGTF